jgi:hypothetical protein
VRRLDSHPYTARFGGLFLLLTLSSPSPRAEGRAGVAKPPGRRVSVLGDVMLLQATWRPTS